MAEDLILRPYQAAAVEGLRQGLRDGHRSQLLVAPTGAGKTQIGMELMNQAKRKYTRAAFMVDRVALVDQTSAALDRYGIDHGVIQAGHWRRRGYERLQVCSAQTVEKRGFFPALDLLIVDEAHCVRRQTAEFIQARPEMRVVGLTATPFTKGLDTLYTNLVNVTTTNKLIDDGFLVPLKMYAARSLDMTGAKVIAGEWSDKEIQERGNKIVGDIVSEWVSKTQLHFGGPAKTIVFAATVAHGEELCRQFQAAGHNFQQISYKDSDDAHRRELIAEFRKPDSQIMGLVSCEVLTKGFDVPDVMVGIAARPYRKSLSSHIQQLGRVMRSSPGKTFGLWLDHCGNVMRFWDDTMAVWQDGVDSLDDGALDAKARKEPDEKTVGKIKCAACGFVLPPNAERCPSCGKERTRRSLIEAVPGQMVEVHGQRPTPTNVPPQFADKERVWREIVGLAIERKGGDMEAAQRFAQAQYRNLYGEFRRGSIDKTEPLIPSIAVRNKVMSQIIAWAKSQKFKATA